MSPRRFLSVVVCSAVAGMLLVDLAEAWGKSPTKTEQREQDYQQQILPALQKYCFKCHAGENFEGELRLDVFPHASVIGTTGRKTWQKVYNKLFADEMPPEGNLLPQKDEVQRLLGFITAAMDDFDCTGPTDPGHETIRRLTRAEYKNTVRDLLGVDVRLADEFPADDVGYGFDNIGDVLSLSPILMEKYLAAAETITREAVAADPFFGQVVRKIPGEALSDGKSRPGQGTGGRTLATSGRVTKEIELPEGGEYLLRCLAFGEQAGDEPCKMTFVVDGRDVKTVEVKVTSSDPQVYEHRMQLPAGKRWLGVGFLNDYWNPKLDEDRNLGVEYLEVVGPLRNAEEVRPEAYKRIFFVRPGNDLSEDQAAAKIVQRFAWLGFRRPASPEECDRLLGLYRQVRADGGSFEEGIQLALVGILVSPHFLFKVELDADPANPQVVRELNEYELAVRMSYFLWSTMPDDELFRLAREVKLRQNLDAQIRRMLADPKAGALVENFAGQWLQLRNLSDLQPDRRLFSFDEPLRQAMRTETEMFFDSLIREDRSILEMIDADYTFVNGRLAQHYGLSGVTGEEFRRVSTAGTPRGGVITQASLLLLTSNPTRTSPVKRGKWIMENILGTPPPPPPPDVPDLDNVKKEMATGTLRQRMEQHRRDPRCATCHTQMDTLGFALENFDAVGAWRNRDEGSDIDPSGTLPDGSKFKGPEELKKLLLADRKDQFTRCLAEKLLTYALGRGIEYYDKCAVDRIVAATAKDEYKLSVLVAQIIHSDPFQKRRAKEKAE